MSPLVAIIWKDIVIEWRNKESVSSMVMFGFLVVIIFSFAFVPTGAERALIVPGMLWITFSFAAILGLNRSLAKELDNECLQGLLLAPLSRSQLYLGKFAGNLIFIVFAELVVLPVFFFLNHLKFNWQFVSILAITALGSCGIAAVGTILSTISASTSMREVMLPVLQIPLTMPLVIAAVRAMSEVLADPPGVISPLLRILAGFTMVYLVASYLIFEYVVEE